MSSAESTEHFIDSVVDGGGLTASRATALVGCIRLSTGKRRAPLARRLQDRVAPEGATDLLSRADL